MANKKITELNEATSITSSDWLVMVDTGDDETKKIHPDLVGASIPIQDTAPASPEENDLWIDTSDNDRLKFYDGTDWVGVSDNIANVSNTYSTSQTDTYSCDYINKLETYSTTETRVGTWIDGKPIYRKTFSFGAMPNTTTISIQHNITNLGKTIRIWGMAYRSSDSRAIPIPDSSPTAEITCSATNQEIYVGTLNDRSSFDDSYVIIEYTKTTD